MGVYLGNQLVAPLGGSVAVKEPPVLQDKTVSPNETQQTVTADADYDGLDSVTVNAISSTYVGSAVTRKGATTYTPNDTAQTIAKDVYLTGVQTISAVPTETLNATENKTYAPSSGKYFSSVDVNVPMPQLQTKNVTPTESEQTVSPDTGYYGLSYVKFGAVSNTYVGSAITRRSGTDLSVSGATVTVPSGYYASQQTKSVASGSAGTPSASKGAVSNHQITVTPTVTNTTGYITGGTKTGTAVTVSASDLVSGALDVSSNGDGIDVTNYKTINVNVPTSGGGGMNVQAYFGVNTVSATSYTATNTKLTVAKTGTYKVSWMGWRSTNSGTSGSQLYINGSAYGSANTSFTNTYGQRVELTNVSLTAGQEIVVRARARSTSYVMAVGNLIIEQTA